MAGNNNAKPAEQAEPAKGAAMVEKTDGASEQTVTPVVHANAASLENITQEELEQLASLAAGCVLGFINFVYRVFAEILAGARVVEGGEERPLTAQDLWVVKFQGAEVTIVTRDGRKFILKDGKVNEAQ